MLKLVLDDYRQGFLTAWKRSITSTGWFMYFYMMVVLPIAQRIDFVRYLFGILPMMLGILLARMYPNQMSKILFLCPLTEQERKRYLETAYWLRVSLPMALCLVAGAAGMRMGRLPLFYFIEMSLLVLSFLLGVNVYCMPDEQEMPALKRTYHLPGMYEIWDMLIQLTGVITMAVFSLVDLTAVFSLHDLLYSDVVIMSVLVMFEMLLCVKMLVTYYKPVMARGLQYEGCYPVNVKK